MKRSTINCPVCAPTGLARKECYTRISYFPLSLPRVGDFYLWSVFATAYDVCYIPEPIVYRRHATIFQILLEKHQPSTFLQQDRLRGHHLLDDYLSRLAQKEVENLPCGLNINEAQQEIRDNGTDEKDAEELLRRIQTALPTAIGATHYKAGQLDQAFKIQSMAYQAQRLSCGIQLEQLFGIRLVPA